MTFSLLTTDFWVILDGTNPSWSSTREAESLRVFETWVYVASGGVESLTANSELTSHA